VAVTGLAVASVYGRAAKSPSFLITHSVVTAVIVVARRLAAGLSGKQIGVTGRPSMEKCVAEPNLVGIASEFESAAGSINDAARRARAIGSEASQETFVAGGRVATKGS
jgi:hypothetical protein